MVSQPAVALRNLPLVLRGAYEYNIVSRFRPIPAREWLFPVTYRCNARCVMCNIWQNPPMQELSLEEWEQTLDDPLFATVESVSLTGGEPTLREDLIQLTSLLIRKLRGLRRITMTTNALAPRRVVEHSGQLVRVCADGGVSLFVGVSLDGIGRVHDEMRNVPGAFDKVCATLEGLLPLRQRGLRLGINCTLTGRNLHDADNVRRWCGERGLAVNYIIASFADSFYANRDSEYDLSITSEQRGELVSFLKQLAAQGRFGTPAAYFYADAACMFEQGASRATPCVFQKDGFILGAQGDLQYCMYSRAIGNVRDGSAASAYYSPENLAHRDEIVATKCRKCTITCFLEVGLAKDLWRWARFVIGGGP